MLEAENPDRFRPSPRHRRLTGTFGPSVCWALAVAAILLALAPFSASASVGWCRSDPVIMVDGDIADIFVSAPADAILKVTGPTQIVVTTPAEADALLIVSTLGFGRGEIVDFEQSRRLKVSDEGIELHIEVYVPATDDQMPVMVEFAPRLLDILAPVASQGTANAWISFRVVL